mmetsp:Transcript_52311/g.138702  ORF Transcript_52311/g.138702 Transcript_52311/m.138702 type:complete len:224 (+) Transcript_52311:565-1236(+)
MHTLVHAARNNLRVGQTKTCLLLAQAGELDNHVRAPQVLGHQDLAISSHNPALHDAQRAVQIGGDLLLALKQDRAHGPRHLHQELCGSVAQIPHLLDPILGQMHGELSSQLRAHSVGQASALQKRLVLLVLPQVLAQTKNEGLGDAVLQSEVVEHVHAPLESHPLGVEVGDDHKRGPDNVRPHDAAHEHAEHTNHILGNPDGIDISVSNGSDRHHSPVQSDHP